MIYFDNSATTPMAPEVLEAMLPHLREEFGNASSVHTVGTRARVALEEARGVIATYIGAEPREIVFTSGGTEANNLAIKGPFFHRYLQGQVWSEMSLVTSPVEHHAVLEPASFLGALGVGVRMLLVTPRGAVVIPSVEPLLDARTVLVSAMLVNNEVGAITDVRALNAAVKEHSRALVHTDAVQALGRMAIDVKALDVDLLSLSAHKIHGPKGIGALYTRSGIEWEPTQHGGSQERNRRGGTEPVALAVGFAEAVRLLERSVETRLRKLSELRRYLLRGLGEIPCVQLNSDPGEGSVDAIVSLSFAEPVLSRLDPDALVIRFDLEGIAISNGSACTSGSLQPSHVLLAMDKGKQVAARSIRVSFSSENTTEQIDRFLSVLSTIVRASN